MGFARLTLMDQHQGVIAFDDRKRGDKLGTLRQHRNRSVQFGDGLIKQHPRLLRVTMFDLASRKL